MTSTNVYNLSDKPSSRVLKPPGGGQSNIFGSPQAPVHSPKKGEENVLTQPKSPIKSVENIENQIKTGENKIEKAPEVKAPMPKTDSYKQRHQASYNPITGESYGNENNAQVRSSTSVRQPPGGASTRPW